MSTSNEQGPRLRRLAYEPIEAQVAACPHCGATIDPTSPLARTAGTGGMDVASPTVAVVTVPDVEAVRTIVVGVVRVLMEALDGRRGAAQLEAVASPTVRRYVRAARLARGPAWVTRLRSMRLCRPHEDVVEATAVVVIAGRIRAVAAHMELEVTGWRCTAFRIL